MDFQAYVTSAHFDRSDQAIFTLGDGTVRFERSEEHTSELQSH